MIYRLRYCNKDGVEARVDIQKGSSTPVIDVEGTERPFILSYNNDKGNKSGMFLSSSADIEIYETPDFNINNLKTSNETELSVTHYINDVISWQGFIIPDFFSIEVRNNPVITMTASDRLGTLKNVTLDDLPTMVNIRELTLTCLSKTGLSLPLKTIADFSNDGTVNAFFSYYVDSQRIKDIKGRSISCYDILSSILIASNSKLVQRAGEWVIINKLQHEIGSGKIYSDTTTFTNYLENIYNFDEVSIGARRTIMPVAGSIGIYHEHGGRKSHPANYDFSLDLSGWNSVNGFVATIENRHITGFLGGTPLFDTERTVKQYLLNYNNWIDDTNNLNTAPYITTDPIQINSPRADRVEVTVDISSTMAEKLSSNTAISFLRYAVILTNGVKTYTLTRAGIFEELDPENISGHSLLLRGGQQSPLLLASPSFSNSESFKGLFEVGEDDDVNNYSATIRIYGSGDQYVTVNYALIKFSDVSELPKGTMYKTEQGEVFTKAYDIETSIFGDYLLSGLDGYFYRYPNDDTSSIYKNVNTLSSPIWTTPMIPGETGELPLLHHSMRQMRRMFSVAHDLLSADIEVSNFDPLAIFVSCDKRYTVVSAQFDFFKSNLSVELEEVAFQNNVIREYIYSYFGDGDSGIKSIGGISGGTGGGGSTGGGLTPEQLEILSFWKKDPDRENTIFTEMNAYSKLELSAYGAGDGGGGGSDYERLDTWASYDSSKAGWVLSAFLGNDLNTRVTDLENLEIGGRNLFSVHNFIADNKARGYSTIEVIQHEGNIAYRSTNIVNNHNIPRYLQGKFEENTQYYFKFNILWESFTDPGAQYVFTIRYTDGSSSTLYASTSHTSRSLLTTAGKTIDYITTTRQFDGTVVVYSIQIKKENKLSDWTIAPEDVQAEIDLKANIESPIFTGTVTAPTFIGALNGNASSATKLQTARTIAGVGFDGTANIAIPFANLSSKPTTLGGYGITDAVTLNTAQTITGEKTFTGNITLGINKYIKGTDNYAGIWNVDNLLWRFGSSKTGSISNIRSEKVGIGTDTPSQKLHVIGNILASGEVTAYVASDIRLKKNIKPINSALETINKLNPVSYSWNAKAKELNSNKTDEVDYGLIAQETEAILPNIVHGIFENKYKGVDYIKLIPILIGAIKELKQEINK